MHHVRAAYCGGERYKILLPRGTAQPTSSQAEAHTDLMPTQQAYSEVKLLFNFPQLYIIGWPRPPSRHIQKKKFPTCLNLIHLDVPAHPAVIFRYETS